MGIGFPNGLGVGSLVLSFGGSHCTATLSGDPGSSPPVPGDAVVTAALMAGGSDHSRFPLKKSCHIVFEEQQGVVCKLQAS